MPSVLVFIMGMKKYEAANDKQRTPKPQFGPQPRGVQIRRGVNKSWWHNTRLGALLAVCVCLWVVLHMGVQRGGVAGGRGTWQELVASGWGVVRTGGGDKVFCDAEWFHFRLSAYVSSLTMTHGLPKKGLCLGYYHVFWISWKFLWFFNRKLWNWWLG